MRTKKEELIDKTLLLIDGSEVLCRTLKSILKDDNLSDFEKVNRAIKVVHNYQEMHRLTNTYEWQTELMKL